MSKIRVTYSGLISFGVRISSVLTGLIFTLIIGRELSVLEFGTWGLINSIMIYALILSPIVNYWITREIARGENSSKTGLLMSTAFSGLGSVIFLVSSFFIMNETNVDNYIIWISIILVPVAFINNSLSAISAGFRPEITSYASFGFEISKIIIAILLVYYLQTGLEGAIISVIISYFVSIVISVIFSFKKLVTELKFVYIKKWFKLSWIPTYRSLPSFFAMSDVIVFSVLTGSVTGVAYFTSARTISYIVNNIRGLNIGLYSKLLETENHSFLEQNLIKFFYLGLPLTAFSIIFAKPALFAINPEYMIGFIVAMVLSVRMFIKSLNQMFFEVLLGLEKTDKNSQSTFKDYLKSNLFWIPTFDLIRHVTYIAILAVIVFLFRENTNQLIDLVLIWSIIGLITEIPLLVFTLNKTKKSVNYKIKKNLLVKYMIITIVVFGITSIIMEEFLEYENNIFKFLPNLVMYAISSIIFYILVTYVLDKPTRILINTILKELKNIG